MKPTLLVLAMLALAATHTAQAQIKPSSEPRMQIDQSGERILLPTVSAEPAIAPQAAAKPQAVPVIRNAGQTRAVKLVGYRNGYYIIEPGRDKGTHARMNNYGPISMALVP